ncbi:hypothetical protein DYU11_29515 [Fibrisoma montanum]|uniref:Uncharacterized protein n=1 Tax=Fibrisoma montanum TaxID=2305895 RepID=A0A418LXX1_9BACT|nr:SIR2 family protein [Fibrisoma montanum]RIV18096.1 hypothetical protein DYU11_29515 [Fibrisoma montanum]
MNLTNTSLLNLNDQQRRSLIDSIRCGECILVLGPYANLVEDGLAQRVRLANHLVKALPTEPPVDSHEQDSFSSVVCRLLLDRNYKRGDIQKEITTFYRQQRGRILPNSPYDLILKLGFRTIFTTDPDCRLMKAFDDRNRNPLGLFFTQVPQPDIIPQLNPSDGLTEETPVILNLFGSTDRPDSLAIGPEEELAQLYALTSGEIGNKINLRIAPRLANCRWYLFVGYNFNSWSLGSIFYFFSKLTEKIRDARVFGLHSKPQAQLTDTTVVYYKNLFPVEGNKDDVRIVNSDAQTFFTELNELAEQFPPPPPPSSRVAFIVYHPKDRDILETFRQSIETKCQEYDLTVKYSQPVTSFDRPLSDDQIHQHVLKEEIVLYLISTNWEIDFQYEDFLDLAQQRNMDAGVKGVLLDNYNLFGANRQRKPAFVDGSIKLLNKQRPFNSQTDCDSLIQEVDAFLEDMEDIVSTTI